MPFVWLRPVSWQTEAPVLHDVSPRWQGFAAGVQVRFAVHAEHAPSLHTAFMPHDCPFGEDVPVSLHVATPFVHALTCPTWQGALASAQAAPTLQVLQTPPEQYIAVPPSPQVVPSVALPAGEQTDWPLLQSIVRF